MNLDHSDSAWGFSMAMVTPALFSTLRQAEREAAAELHALADAYARRQNNRRRSLPLSPAEQASLRRLGIILMQQLANGVCFLTMARLAVLAGGVTGGVMAQVTITLNTMFHPAQTQRFNPSRLLSRIMNGDADWTAPLSAERRLGLACAFGKTAAGLGYGTDWRPQWREITDGTAQG